MSYRSILSKSKHHGYRSVRGCAALAAMYFNSGSNTIMEYFRQCGVTVSKILFEYFVAKDKKRITNSRKNNEQRRNRILKKATARENSIRASADVTDYNPGGFNL